MGCRLNNRCDYSHVSLHACKTGAGVAGRFAPPSAAAGAALAFLALGL